MPTFSFVVRRRGLGGLSIAPVCVALGIAVAACSGGGASGAQPANAPIGVQATQLYVTIENKAGLPLIDVDVAIVPVGPPVPYSKYVGRLENAERRSMPLGDFHGRDGTSFNLRVVRPKNIRVTAKDLIGKPYEVTVPWQ